MTLDQHCLVLGSGLLRNCLANSYLVSTARFLKSGGFACGFLLLRIFLRGHDGRVRSSRVVKVLHLSCWFQGMVSLCWLSGTEIVSLRTCNNSTLIDPSNCGVWASMMVFETVTSHTIVSSRLDNIHRWNVDRRHIWLLFMGLNVKLWVN